MKTYRRQFMLSALLFSYAGFAGNEGKNLFQGPPVLMQSSLDPSTYTAEKLRKLAHPNLLYVNHDLLAEKLRKAGVKIPSSGIAPEDIKDFVNEVAYLIPSGDEPEGTFTKESKTFYSDRYGGIGMNDNFGSGRAVSSGTIQIKGSGPTSQIGADKTHDIGHAHGRANSVEGIHEAIWGEILSRELPYGANRVLALIDTGTVITADGSNFPSILIIREDPLRPAHLMKNPNLKTDSMRTHDTTRVNKILKRLSDILPKPVGFSSIDEYDKVKAGSKELISRIARQYAASYAKSVYHGATSASNILLDGGMIDFGTQTALSGYQKVQQINEDGEGPNGDTMTQKHELIMDVVTDLKANVPDNLKSAIPSLKSAYTTYDTAYKQALDREMLSLAGIPTEFLENLSKTAEGKAFSKVLLKIAAAGNNETVLPGWREVPDTATYNLGRILERLAQAHQTDPQNLGKSLNSLVKDVLTKEELSTAYSQFHGRLQSASQRAGLKPNDLRTYQIEAVKIRNRKMPELYTSNLHAKGYYENLWKLVEKTKNSSNPTVIQDFIDQRVRNNSRTFKDAGPFQIVTGEELDPISKKPTRRYFDAKSGKYNSTGSAMGSFPKSAGNRSECIKAVSQAIGLSGI